MPEIFKKEFEDLYNQKKQENYNFIIEKETLINNEKFKYLEFNIDHSLLKCAMNLAKRKSQFTMDQNQAGIRRDEITKLQKCCQGVLAEMFIHVLLLERYGFKVLRYDLERENFLYKVEEYDLKIQIDNDFYEVESRSSNIHHTSIEKFINYDIIIGPYENRFKIEDELADFHFRPIYMPDFEPFEIKDGKYHYSDKLITGEVKLIITGVATKEEFLKYGYKKSLGQRGTIYQVVDVSIIGDISKMDEKFKDIISE